MGNLLKIGVLVAICLIPLFTIPVFAPSHPEFVGMGFYENELHEFSFNAPTSWNYQENVQLGDVPMFIVIVFPDEFSLSSLDKSQAGLYDLTPALSGLQFQIDSPTIGVQYEYVSQSQVPVLNDRTVENYVSEQIRLVILNGKITSSNVESRSWGWIVTTEYFFNLNLGFGDSLSFLAEDKSYFFKDRDLYIVSYGSIEKYYDGYYPVFEDVVNTLVIKNVNVPEFQEIAMVVLASSIILVVAFARKFKVLKILNS